MLSYRHAFHAGNHADVFKHTFLVMLLERFNAKETPYTVIDTHAGSARYDLNDECARKTLDAQSGILKLLESIPHSQQTHSPALSRSFSKASDLGQSAPHPSDSEVAFRSSSPAAERSASEVVIRPSPLQTCALSHDDLQSVRKPSDSADLLGLHSKEYPSNLINFQKYLRFVKDCLEAGYYPGSPEIERAFMRAKDALILSELHPNEITALERNMRLKTVNVDNAPAVHIHHRNGFEAMQALTPAKTKRGIVFCDPSYEDASDWERTADSFIKTHKRWAGATLALWYPLVAVKKIERDAMKQKITAGIKGEKTERDILDALLCVNTENSHRESALKDVNHSEPPRLYGSGILVVNPPWKIDDELAAVLPYLAETLGTKGAGSYKINNY